MNNFISLERLYGPNFLNKVNKTSIMIVGLGGVGSWCAESLIRSGVSNLTLVDLDEVCQSNINRQIHALTSTIGRPKVQVMKDRLLKINPHANIKAIEEFLTKDTAPNIITEENHIVIDAIDNYVNKVEIALECKKKNIHLIMCGASGGIVSPYNIIVTDLNHSFKDRLLKRVRKKLHQDHNWSEGKEKAWNIHAVFSKDERLVFGSKGVDQVNGHHLDNKHVLSKREQDILVLNCEGSLGSSCFVTSTFGMFAASVAFDIILKLNKKS